MKRLASKSAMAQKKKRKIKQGQITSAVIPPLEQVESSHQKEGGTAVPKRQRGPEPSKPKAPPPSFIESCSIRKQAEPYRLAIASLPISVLNCSWSYSANRELDPKHIDQLFQSFCYGQLDRQSPENYIQVLCDASTYNRVLQASNERNLTSTAYQIPLLYDWGTATSEQPEVLAGQHRIEALQRYAKHTGASPDSLYWIWAQLASTSEREPSLFSSQRNKNKKVLEERMRDIACLGSDAKFPISRLVTLWRNDRWRQMATEWCRITLGRSLFNISTWERMASYRIDD
ncbi:hypothetical protein FGRMN_3979, partial [Fusarium graminum]